MEISGFSLEECSSNFVEDSREKEDQVSFGLWTQVESRASLQNRVKPLMSRPPDRVRGEIKGGCDDERGKYVEGIVTFEWDNKNENQKGDPDNSGHDINSTDRN